MMLLYRPSSAPRCRQLCALVVARRLCVSHLSSPLPPVVPSGAAAVSSSDATSSSSLTSASPPKSLIVDRIKSRRRLNATGDGYASANKANGGSEDVQPPTHDDGRNFFFFRAAKKKAPWGAVQLRDSWSIDAMSKKGDYDNMNERMHREHRYNPFERQRRVLKWAGLLIVPTFVLGMFIGYAYLTGGRMLWSGDIQFVLNYIRRCDCSPRSRLYPYRIDGVDEYPPHIMEYRRVEKERLARVAQEKEDAKRQEEAKLRDAIERRPVRSAVA